MNRLLAILRALSTRGALIALALAASPAGAQLVDITGAPLYGSRSAHPNIVLATSVEFPTVAAAYVNTTYDRTASYSGYFDPTRCYLYVGTAVLLTAPLDIGFTQVALADSNHECNGGLWFSGNFMNWATASAIDEYRYVMTGGNRINENALLGGTTLERAYLPDGTIPGVDPFYNTGNFPILNVCSSNCPGGYTNIVSVLSRVVPATVAGTGYVSIGNCGTLVFFAASTTSSNCLAPSNSRGSYHVAVTVCDSTEGPARTDLCLLYPNGKYKPAGVAQQYSSNMRFAGFGYLMDRNVGSYTFPSCANQPAGTAGWNPCRYGGVLRSPMKYLGAYSYDGNQVPTSNAKAEINPTDGTFYADPEGTASTAGGSYSGFINYLNKFGQTGLYKRYDPDGEMWYEALRYLSGLPPTPDATSTTSGTIPNAVLDNYPTAYTNAARTTWGDPLANQSTCSANYIIAIGDQQTNYDGYLPGSTSANWTLSGYASERPSSRPVDEHGLDANLWTQRVATLETTTPPLSSYVNTNANYDSPGEYDPNVGNLATAQYICCASNLVAGAAFWANVNDIRPDLTGTQTVKTIMVDTYPQEPIPINKRPLYLAAKYGGFNNTIDRTADAYPNPFYASDPSNPTGAAIRSDSEWADSTGAPTNFLLASNPQKLISGIRNAFSRIQNGSGTISGAGLTASSLAYGGAYAYVASFNPNYWSGTVLAKQITQSNGVITTSSGSVWDAGALLTTRCGGSTSTNCTDTDTSSSKRNIVTTIRSASGVRSATPFTFTNLATDTQYSTVLNTNPSTNAVDNLGQLRVNYLSGNRAAEVSTIGFRIRNSPLGDIINSGPTYVGAPTTAIADADYQAFYTQYAITNPRTAAVYVGANDGMMHALNAASGQELFAYIPNFINYELSDLTNPAYSHEAFVDATPAVKEVKSNGSWKTVLVSGAGTGAQGVFALDVTDPSNFGSSNVIFEFSDADDADLGNVVSAPEIVKLQTGSTGSPAVASYGYFAVVTGYNNKSTTKNGNRTDTSVSGDTADRGVLFLLSLDRTLGTSWVLGTNYYKYYFPASNTAIANALGPVKSFLNRDGSGSAAALYFGDLQGNMWRLNTVGAPSAWTPSRGTVSSPLPFFVATTDNTGSVRQPITSQPQVSNGPYNSQLVFFGTGKYLGLSDLAAPYVQQSEYGLIDYNQGTLITRSSLATRTATVSGTTVQVTGSAFGYSGTAGANGWVLNFPSTSSGERSIFQPSLSNGFLSFTTLTVASNVCGAGGGYVYLLNALTGLPDSSLSGVGGNLSTVGIPGPPKLVDLYLVPGTTRATGEQIGTRTTTTLVSGTSGTIAGSQDVTAKAPPVGRVNWREITNYNDQPRN